MLLVALAVPTLLPAQASGPARCLQPERWRSRALSASVAAAAAAAAHGPATVSSAAAAAEGGLAVADALRADGVVRVDGVLTPDMATELLGCVDQRVHTAANMPRMTYSAQTLEHQNPREGAVAD